MCKGSAVQHRASRKRVPRWVSEFLDVAVVGFLAVRMKASWSEKRGGDYPLPWWVRAPSTAWRALSFATATRSHHLLSFTLSHLLLVPIVLYLKNSNKTLLAMGTAQQQNRCLASIEVFR